MNPILEKALEYLHSLNVNIEESLSNPNDEDKAITLFKILHAHDIPLIAEEIEKWALSKEGVSQHHAHALGFLARQIAGGMEVRLTYGDYARHIPHNIVEILSEKIEDEGA